MRAPDPRNDVVRALLAKSGNKCAFPKCEHKIVNTKHQFIAEICHIEAAAEGGQRWRADMNDSERRSFDNLLILCHAHHVETNDENVWTTPKLQTMKRRHEARYHRFAGQRAITDDSVVAQARNAFEEQWSIATKVERLKHDYWRRQHSLQRRAEHLEAQLDRLYGPLSFFLECNARCHEHATAIFDSMMELATNGVQVGGAIEAWDAVNDIIKENNLASLNVLCAGWRWVDHNELDEFVKFALEVLRYRIEILEKKPIPKELTAVNLRNPVRPGLFFRPEFVNRVRRKIIAIHEEIAKLHAASSDNVLE